jgi:transposase
MRQTHEAGEAVVDYTGAKLAVVDPDTGEIRDAEVFVHCMAASNFIYSEAQWSQDTASWIGGHQRAYEDLGGVPPMTVVDNLKAGVTHPCRYEPDLNRTYHDFAVHCGTAVVPARIKKPRDKAKAETAVQIVERELMAPLRNVTLIGLAGANRAMAERRHVVNGRPMRHVGKSRLELLEAIDRPALLPLPDRPFELGDWKIAKVAIDYHVEFDHHFYSVPYQLLRRQVEVRASLRLIEVFADGVRVATHVRSHQRGGHTTDPAHMPESHRAYAEWTPERFRAWANQLGPETAAVITSLLDGRAHPQQAFRSCLGVLRLADRYTPARLEEACRYGRTVGAIRYKNLKHILDAGLDASTGDEIPVALPSHANVRGAEYFQ